MKKTTKRKSKRLEFDEAIIRKIAVKAAKADSNFKRYCEELIINDSKR